MSDMVLVHWLLITTSSAIVFYGLEVLDRMGPTTNQLIRFAVVLKTTGAFLVALVHLASVLTAQNGDDTVPVLLLITGMLLQKAADRRRRFRTCEEDCPLREKRP